MIKVLVAGGCGFIGSNLCRYLKKNNFNVASVDNLSKIYSNFNQKRLIQEGIFNYKLDLSNNNNLSKIKFRADIIIDCCAEPAVEVSKINPIKVFDNNLVSTLNILEKAKKDNSKIIFLSTSRIYPIQISYNLFENFKKKKNDKILFNEQTKTLGPKTIYGFTKIASESLIEEYSYAYGLKYIINRIGVVTGNWQFGKVEQGIVSLWMWRHINKKNLTYKGYGASGSQIRDVLFVDDLNNLIKKQISKFELISNKLFCVGGGLNNSLNLKQLTNFCQIITGNKVKIYKDKKNYKYDIPFYITDNKKVSKIYSWKPLIPLNKGFVDIYNWLINNKNSVKKFF
jgi:CDP-paratose 2-epimerase